MQTEPNPTPSETVVQTPNPARSDEPDFSRPARLIAELIVAPDFPKSSMGEMVDIGGYTGIVVDVVNQSLKVKSAEGLTKSFNAGGLRKLYGPRVIPEPSPAREVSPPPPPRKVAAATVAPPLPTPKRDIVLQPDFSKPVLTISSFMTRLDYPRCLLGEHVEIGGYSGVVVEIAGRSIKVRSEVEITRSYNADSLKKLYGS